LEQKGVDVLLAIEVLQHAVQGNMDIATIATSDLDFFPIFEALVQTRVKTELICDPVFTPRELMYAADMVQPLNAVTFRNWCKQEYQAKFTLVTRGVEPDWKPDDELSLEVEGFYKGKRFQLYKSIIKESSFVAYSEADSQITESNSSFLLIELFRSGSSGTVELVNPDRAYWR
jgi:hypothetical protein